METKSAESIETNRTPINEPADGTRVVIRLRDGAEKWCRACAGEWLVVWRDDALGARDYVVPEDEPGCWFGDQIDCVPWNLLEKDIVEMYDLVARSL